MKFKIQMRSDLKGSDNMQFNAIKSAKTLAFSLLLAGCTTNAPLYQVDFVLVNDLKEAQLSKSNVGEFKDGSSEVNSVSVRGLSIGSPYNDSFAAYIAKALEDQLKQANLFDKNADTVISGELLTNHVDGSGMSTGESDISARFVVTKKGNVLYNKIHTIHHEWESSFVGYTAAQNTLQNYPVAVQKLIKTLVNDPDFRKSLQ